MVVIVDCYLTCITAYFVCNICGAQLFLCNISYMVCYCCYTRRIELGLGCADAAAAVRHGSFFGWRSAMARSLRKNVFKQHLRTL